MHRIVSFFAFFSLVGMAGVLAGCASTRDSVRDALVERYRLSRIEIDGHIARPGVVLILRTGGVSANKLRVRQAPKSLPVQVHDYAQVEVASDGRLTATPGALTLDTATRLVVLDLKVEQDRVRLFTHTFVRVRLPDGQAAYGCTEFVFGADPDLLARGDIGALQERIEHWLSREGSA